jgi:predicted metal-dependent peptidase
MTSRPLENAIVRLLKRRPFYGYLLVGLHRAEAASDHSLGVTIRAGTPTISVNEGLFAEFTAEEQEALLEHVIKHLLHLHMARRKERNRHDWDLACDLAINPTIEGLPAGALQPKRFLLKPGLAAEEYYRLLVDPFDTGSLRGAGKGSADQDSSGEAGSAEPEQRHANEADAPDEAEPLDDHQVWEEADSTPLKLAEELVRGMVRDAWQRCDGQVPAELRQLVQGLLAPPTIPWRMVLRQFVATAGRVGRQSSWQRENRRFAHTTPGSRKRHRLNLLIGVDVSDSTNAPELREAFARELLQIARGREAQLTVLYANSRIQRLETFRGKPSVVESYVGGGFTDLRPVFDHARQMHPQPAAVVYLTDGIGPAPETMEFPTLWVLTREGERPVPWGIELRLDV